MGEKVDDGDGINNANLSTHKKTTSTGFSQNVGAPTVV
jgi:hypothetical protein